jgi:hypothetical protein
VPNPERFTIDMEFLGITIQFYDDGANAIQAPHRKERNDEAISD